MSILRRTPLAALAIPIVSIACGSAVPLPTGSSDASIDGGAGDAHDDVGFEMRGSARCCKEGTGDACCAGLSPQVCAPYGGAYGHCIEEGDSYEGKTLCAGCCEGLVRGGGLVPGDAAPPEVDGLRLGCDYGPPPSIITCLRCGDGVCGIAEDYCNCPRDCPAP